MPNWSGVIIGAASLFIIGIFHPIVVKCEYYFGEKVWPLFLVLGLLCAGASMMTENCTLSGILGVLSCVLLWCIRELKEQKQRVERGWFPKRDK